MAQELIYWIKSGKINQYAPVNAIIDQCPSSPLIGRKSTSINNNWAIERTWSVWESLDNQTL